MDSGSNKLRIEGARLKGQDFRVEGLGDQVWATKQFHMKRTFISKPNRRMHKLQRAVFSMPVFVRY